MHADTQGQSFPVFGLAYLLGIDLVPRIRNFHDLTFHRPHPQVRYRHIDALFSTDPRAAINWGLIESEWPTLVRVTTSVKEGAPGYCRPPHAERVVMLPSGTVTMFPA